MSARGKPATIATRCALVRPDHTTATALAERGVETGSDWALSRRAVATALAPPTGASVTAFVRLDAPESRLGTTGWVGMALPHSGQNNPFDALPHPEHTMKSPLPCKPSAPAAPSER